MVLREMGATGGRPSVEMPPELEAVWTTIVAVVGMAVPLILEVEYVSSDQGRFVVVVVVVVVDREGDVARSWRDIGRADGRS